MPAALTDTAYLQYSLQQHRWVSVQHQCFRFGSSAGLKSVCWLSLACWRPDFVLSTSCDGLRSYSFYLCQGGRFLVCLFVCLLNSRVTQQVLNRFPLKLEHGPGRRPLKFNVDPQPEFFLITFLSHWEIIFQWKYSLDMNVWYINDRVALTIQTLFFLHYIKYIATLDICGCDSR